MCGIAGVYNFDSQKSADRSVLESMTNEIKHRGPDDEGFFYHKNLGLGFRRLSIIDLSKNGNQPMCNEDGNLWIIFNGEFYNFLDYRESLIKKGHIFKSRTDSEVVLHLYEEHGEKCLGLMNGMFAFCIYDKARNEMFIARDRLGVKPLYYYKDDRRFVFASEIKAILRDKSIKREINHNSLSDYLTFFVTLGSGTIFKNIYKLPAGHFLRIRNDLVEIKKYWDIEDSVINGAEVEDQYAERLDELLYESVSRRLISDVPLGVFLSGGLDSSGIVAYMSKNLVSKDNIRSFSINFPGSRFDEGKYAREISRLFKTKHTEFDLKEGFIENVPRIVYALDEPFCDAAAFATFFLAKMAREYVTVALTGDGGDEVFAGYPFRYSMDARVSKYSFTPLGLRKFLRNILNGITPFGSKGTKNFISKAAIYSKYISSSPDEAFLLSFAVFDEGEKKEILDDKIESMLDGYRSIQHLFKHKHERLDTVNQRLYFDIKTTLTDQMLMKVDKMTMASSLEARQPYLDYRLVEFAMRIPSRFKIKGTSGKLILKKTLQKYLPPDIVYRRKSGFNVPLDEWFRTGLRNYAREILSEENIKKRGLFKYSEVERMISDHLSYRRNNALKIFALIILEIWFQQYMDKVN
jgi:asparagine synthase (glutamine-hydrolysing)